MRSLARSATHESSRVRRRLPTLQALLACLGAALLSQAESAEPVERDPAEKNEAHQAERPAPLASPDPFAGKTVRSRQMAMDLILHRLGNAPRVGQFFPDFELPRTDGEGTVRLSEEAAKAPVVLLFGSATCDELSANLDGIQKLWKAHGHAYRFLFVYGREAHPSDGWLAEGRQTFPDPKSLRERLNRRRNVPRSFPSQYWSIGWMIPCSFAGPHGLHAPLYWIRTAG